MFAYVRFSFRIMRALVIEEKLRVSSEEVSSLPSWSAIVIALSGGGPGGW